MATVQTLITSCRYDLKDYGKGVIYDNAELVDYLNRMVGIMDTTLASLKSDLCEAEDETLSLAEDATTTDVSALNNDLWDSIRDIWIDDDLLTQITIDEMRKKRKFDLNDGQPYYWALGGRTLYFEKTADDDYTLTIYYNKKTATLSLTDSMPYNSIFDELFRELLVGHAKAKKEGRLMQTDSYYSELFRRRAMSETIRRDYIKKTYSKDY